MDRLTPAQERLLRAVVATNGGGIVAGHSETQRSMKVMRRLEDLGLVQGKKSHPWIAVHTRAGLDWVRAKTLPQPDAAPEGGEVGT